jgi:dCTP deaminase
MVDGYYELVKNIDNILEGATKQSIKGSSIDLRIDEIAMVRADNKTLKLSEKSDYKDLFEEVNLSKGYELQPGDYLLGKTYEKVKIPENRCGIILPRSTFARLGLQLPVSEYANPGYEGHLPICIHNTSKVAIEIPPYYRVVQLLLMHVNGKTLPYNSQIDKKYFDESGKSISLNDEELIGKKILTSDDLELLGL